MLNKLERLNFGKHKGKLISAVKITNPEYLIWLKESDNLWRVSGGWQEEITKLYNENKNKIYAGSYTYLRY